MTPAILGLGTAVPTHSIDQDEAVALAAALAGADATQSEWLTSLFRRTRVRSRGSVLLKEPNGCLRSRLPFFPPAAASDDHGPSTRTRLERYEREATPLAAASARAALRDAAVEPGEITHLITVSCTGFAAPGVDLRLIPDLGLSPTVGRTHVGFMGCHGAVNALRVASAFTAAAPAARVLVTAVELCSLHFAYGGDPQQMVANALFADGAASAVVGHSVAIDRWRLAATGSCLVPDSGDAMGWRIRDYGFEMSLSPRVPELIREHLRPWLVGWLAEHGTSIAGVGSWAVHPGGPKVIGAVAQALGLTETAMAPSRAVLADHGNMSSPTLLFIVEALRRAGAPRPCVALAFGPGLVVEGALFL